VGEGGLGEVGMKPSIDTPSSNQMLLEGRIGVGEESVVRKNQAMWWREFCVARVVNGPVQGAVCPPESKKRRII